MVLFTAGAQLVDTLIVKVAVFAAEQALNIVKWGGSSVYSYYWPSLSECDKLRAENLRLKHELVALERLNDNEILMIKDSEDY